MTNEEVDAVIIGGGAGGVPAAIRARQLGGRTVLIEKEHLGGVCMNKGCIPAKTFLTTAKLYRDIQKAGDFCLKTAPPEVDWDALMAKRDDIVRYLRLGTESILKSNEVEILRGEARFAGANRIRVGDHYLRTKSVIIASGSSLIPPHVSGIDQPGVLPADRVFNLREIPAKVAVLGSGPVELELAQYFCFMGSEVTVLERHKRILPGDEYGDVAGRLSGALKAQGIKILTKTRIKAVKTEGKGLFLSLQRKDGEDGLQVDRMFHANRVPSIAGLQVENAGLPTNGGSLSVDSGMRTAVPNIFAIGDVTGPPFFSHRATIMGIVAAENAMGSDRRLDPSMLIHAVSTRPEAASVGFTEKQAKEKGFRVSTATIPYSTNSLGMISLETQGAVSIVADAEWGQVLGVHIVGPNATELISEGALAVEIEATLEDLADTIRYHPSISESQVDAGREALGRGIYVLR